MKPQIPGEEEYFDDEKSGLQFITIGGAAMLLGCARQSVHLETRPAEGLKPRVARRDGRPIKTVVSLDEVMELVRAKHGEQGPGDKSPAEDRVAPELPQLASAVSSMQEARLRQQLEALTRENARLKQRLEVIEPLLLHQMEALATFLRSEGESGPAS